MTVIPDLRRRLLAQLHIAKKQLGLDDETWRAMLWTVGRVKSSADLDAAGLQRVRDHLVKRGAKLGRGGYPKRPRVAVDREAQVRKIEALLADAGRPWTYLTDGADGKPSMVLRICGVARIEFCDSERLRKLIAALEYDARRRQVRKIEALLADAGWTWGYLTGGWPSMVMRICGVTRIEFCDSEALGKLIAALEYDRKQREGRETHEAHPPPSLPLEGRGDE